MRDDLHAEFDSIVAGMGLEADTADAVAYDYGTMGDVTLLDLYADTRRELMDRRELLLATSLRGTDLGGIYHGCVLELRKRHLL